MYVYVYVYKGILMLKWSFMMDSTCDLICYWKGEVGFTPSDCISHI